MIAVLAGSAWAGKAPAWVGQPYAGKDPAAVVCADAASTLPDGELARTEAELLARARVAEQVSAQLLRDTGRAGGTLTDELRARTDQVLTGLRYEATFFDPSPAKPKRVYVLACAPAGGAPVPSPAPARVADGVPDVQRELRVGGHGAADAALVVGVEDYFVLPDVPHAVRDAEAFYETLVYTVGVPADHVVKLTGTPSREQIEQGLETAAAAAGAGGTLWVYFAGHGAADPVDGARLLLGADVQPDVRSLGARGVPVAALSGTKTQAARTLVVADTCYAGVGRDGADLLPGKRFAVPAWALPTASATVWTATAANELSGPYAPAAQGLFTYFVVGALRGWADGELGGGADGAVTLAEAQAYVARAVAAVSNHAQTPSTSGGGDAGVVLTGGAGLERGPELAALPR
jgi:hypothetical protein